MPEELTCGEVLAATSGRLLGGKMDAKFTGVSTDSRQPLPGGLFVALRGLKFDGNQFATAALKGGMSGCVVTSWTDDIPEGTCVIEVRDGLTAYGQIASLWRKRFSLPVIAITGSVGKTTVKEMCRLALTSLGNVCATERNENNEIGVPRTLLHLNSTHSAAVVEIAMRHRGEILSLSKVAQPTVGVITAIGSAHAGIVGGPDEIFEAKSELLQTLAPDCAAVLPYDSPYFDRLLGRGPEHVVSFGFHQGADVAASDIFLSPMGTGFRLHQKRRVLWAEVPFVGRHFIYCALAALAAAVAVKIDIAEALEGLKEFRPDPGRGALLQLPNGARLIDDTYNASPESMNAALKLLRDMPAGRRIACLGSMLELGDLSRAAHREIGKRAAQIADKLFCVGEEARDICDAALEAGIAEAIWLSDSSSLTEALSRELQSEDLVLLKASHSVGLEQTVKSLSELVCA
jgi:UDP-N-acetylmuramoyl-tripeptide--D-alanyl-D-alanine ligase